MKIDSDLSPRQAGGVGDVFESIDPTNEKDRGLLRTAMKWWPARWRGLSDNFKDRVIESLGKGLETVDEVMSSPESQDHAIRAAGAAASIAKTAAMMEGQVQTDDWNADKNERLDAGKATERIGAETDGISRMCRVLGVSRNAPADQS